MAEYPRIFDLSKLISNQGYDCIVEAIFTNVDPTSLVKCRLVSKSWKALIDTRRTILVYQLQQLKQTKLEVPDAKVWYKLRRIVQSQRKHSIIEEFPEFRRAFLDLERNATGHELSIIVMFLQKYSKHQKFPIEKLRHYGWDKRILRSPLHQAIIHEDLAMVNLFIAYAFKKHINLNVPDGNGLTAFHFACLHGKLEVVKLFLENVKEEFLQVNVLDQNGNSPLQLVCIGNQPETLQLLLDRSIQFGIDINTVDKNERTPLHLAAMLGHEKVVKVLLEASIDHEINVNAFDIGQWTPFTTACFYGHLKIAKLMIQESRKYGINLNLLDWNETSALFYAIKFKHLEIARLMIDESRNQNISLNPNNDSFITYFLTINAWVDLLGGLVYGRRPDLWNPLLISYFICSNLFWLKSKINTNFFAEVSGCLVASLFYMIFVPLIDSRIRESYEYYLVPFFISTFTLICARVGLLDYLDSS